MDPALPTTYWSAHRTNLASKPIADDGRATLIARDRGLLAPEAITLDRRRRLRLGNGRGE